MVHELLEDFIIIITIIIIIIVNFEGEPSTPPTQKKGIFRVTMRILRVGNGKNETGVRPRNSIWRRRNSVWRKVEQTYIKHVLASVVTP